MPYRGRKQFKKISPVSSRKSMASKKYVRKSKSLTVAVKRLISKELEVKCAPNYVLADQLAVPGGGLNPASTLGFSTVSIFPPITQGVGDGQRIGNKVKVKSLMFNYTIRAQDVSATNNFTGLPFLVRVVLYKHRYATDDSSPLLLLDSGNSAVNIGATPDDYIKPYNKKEFQIFYSRTFQMQPIRNTLTTPISTDNVANGTKTMITRRVRVSIPAKTLIFSDASTLPANAGIFAGFCCCNIDGTTISSGQYRFMVNAESQIYYTDA